MVNRKDFRPSNAFGSMSSKDRQVIQSSRKKIGSRDDVIKGFLNRNPMKTSNDSLSTDGKYLKSYNTVIATRQSDGSVLVNQTKYSSTTSAQQSKLLSELKSSGTKYSVTGGYERGYEGEDLEKDYSRQIVDEKKASKEYSDLAKKNPEHKEKLQEISKEESTHAKELKKLGGFESEKDKEKIMNKQLPTRYTKIEMGDYKTSPSGFVTDIDGKKVVYVNNIKYEKHGNAKVYINSNGDALHYTDINKSEFKRMNKESSLHEQKSRQESSNRPTGRLTLSDIKSRNSSAGQYFFSKDTMRMYRQVGAKYRTRYDKKTDTNYVIVNMRKYPESTERKNVVYKFNKENGHLDIQD